MEVNLAEKFSFLDSPAVRVALRHSCLFFFFFLAALSLHYCSKAFSNCSAWGLLSTCGAGVSHCGSFSCCRAQALEYMGFSNCGTQA